MSKLYSGAEIVFKCLEDQDVEFIFGYPGGAVLPIYDELKNHSSIKHILVRHEQGAGHAAEGYARSSGKPGVVLVTSGPGATNVVTALTDAYMDSVPLVCISGQVPTHLIGTDAFQECDTTGITRPCTKHNWLVKDIKDLSKTLHEAFKVATTGRPGPVLVDIPKDIQFAKIGYSKPKTEKKLNGKSLNHFSQNDINNLIELISNIRSTKAELKITPKLYCDISFAEKSRKLKELINSNLNLIKQVGRVNNVSMNKKDNKNTIDILVLKEKLSLKFDEDVDLTSQKKRILQKLDSINEQISSLNNKLQNKAYLSNAPKEIVQNDKNLVKELTIEDAKLRSIVSSIY